MKLIYSIILTFLSTSCFGQSIQLFQNNKVDLNKLQSLPNRNQFQLNGSTFNFEKVQITSPDFSVIDSKSKDRKVQVGKFYHDKTKNATLSVFDKSFVLVYDSLEVFNDGRKTYKIQPQRHFPTGCYTDDDSPQQSGLEVNSVVSPQGCRLVQIYFEADYKLFQEKGSSVQNTVNYVTSLFNQVALLYANEQINVQISQIKVWNAPDPYIPFTNIGSVLNKFRTDLNGTFNGNLAHLLTTRSLGGGIAYVDVLCFKNYACGVSAIQTSFQNIPTYSWSVEVVTHELGHNFGSWHTHSCNWPNGPLDNCYSPEGNCNPGPTPTNGGTIMSYCHLTQYGINFNNGFGIVPGNWIRQKYNNATCLSGTSAPPSGLLSMDITQSTAKVQWNLISGSVYQLQWKRSIDLQWNTVSNLTTGYFILSGLTSSTQYEWKIKSDCSTYSSVQTFTTLSTNPPPSCPVILVLTFIDVTQSSFKIQWPIVSGATTYFLQYRKTGVSNWIEYGEIPTNSLTISNLISNTQYEVKVRPNCNPTFSSVFLIKTLSSGGGLCMSPTNLNVSNLTGSSATLSWNPVVGATSYQIALKFPNSSNFFTIGQTFTNTTVNFYGFDLNSTYQWKVKANCSDWSTVNTFTTLSNFIEPLFGFTIIPNKVIIFPNPAEKYLTILGNTALEYSIFDSIGSLRQTGTIIQNRIDITNLQKGFYFLKIGKSTIKFIKK